ncbi:hypothetical protein CROQUDRAFT_725111 [Cronartium quercuum f. sp. fusiforme G11]|uniref:Uncharacterized protein n=1 Tax=Cronartium quercuum f. sp. fusiforme G11 TaxID=708437 RepID=A0A9P6N9G8_9BASI|nr:hypothetical protein CROQUDRAFT_725111 [Cronartium quercuum f. sp. fusiforme G11]
MSKTPASRTESERNSNNAFSFGSYATSPAPAPGAAPITNVLGGPPPYQAPAGLFGPPSPVPSLPRVSLFGISTTTSSFGSPAAPSTSNLGSRSLFESVSVGDHSCHPSPRPPLESQNRYIPTVVVEYEHTPSQKSLFYPISAMGVYRDWSFEELRFYDHRPSRANVPTYSPFKLNTSPATKVPNKVVFEKYHLTSGTTAIFDSEELLKFVDTNSASTLESVLGKLLQLATVRTEKPAGSEPGPSNQPATTEPELFTKPVFSREASTSTQPATSREASTSTQPAAPEPGAPIKPASAIPKPNTNFFTSPAESRPSTSTEHEAAQTDPNSYDLQLSDPNERRARFASLSTGTVTFSSTIWEDAIRVLVKESPFMVEKLKDARSVTEHELAKRFKDLMETASNTPRFVDGVKRFSIQVSELLDETFAKLVTAVEDQSTQIVK